MAVHRCPVLYPAPLRIDERIAFYPIHVVLKFQIDNVREEQIRFLGVPVGTRFLIPIVTGIGDRHLHPINLVR